MEGKGVSGSMKRRMVCLVCLKRSVQEEGSMSSDFACLHTISVLYP